jgi:hypothetical protein
MPHTIDDYALDNGWSLSFSNPDNLFYQKGKSLTITKNSDGTADLFIQGNVQFSRVPFQSEYGRLNGRCTEGYTVTVTIVDPDARMIVGVVQGEPSTLPVAGTWGADANGG